MREIIEYRPNFTVELDDGEIVNEEKNIQLILGIGGTVDEVLINSKSRLLGDISDKSYQRI